MEYGEWMCKSVFASMGTFLIASFKDIRDQGIRLAVNSDGFPLKQKRQPDLRAGCYPM